MGGQNTKSIYLWSNQLIAATIRHWFKGRFPHIYLEQLICIHLVNAASESYVHDQEIKSVGTD